ncbi:MAG: replicative DNA helicase [Clostridia bacterium]|nr:replicative DNA helicase [Clostridia bacterium]
MANDFNKQMPFSLQAEQSVLGSILIDPQKFNDVANLLNESDFYLDVHKLMYSSMHTLAMDQSRQIDAVTLTNAMVERTDMDEASCRSNIMVILNATPTSANLLDYVSIVKEKSLRRQLIEAATEIDGLSFDDGENVYNTIERAEQLIYGVSNGIQNNDLIEIKKLLVEAHTNLAELAKDPDQFRGVQTHYSGLDNYLVGMNKGDLIIVGARPAMGKTSFVLNIAENAAYKGKKTVCIFSLEMSAEEIVKRMLSTEACIPSTKLRSGKLDPQDWDKLGQAASKLAECNIYIDGTSESTVSRMKAKLNRIKGLKSNGLVIIDYLQLMQDPNEKKSGRTAEVSAISRALKLMAKELEVPVICCSQLNRELEKTKEKIPTMADLRESGSIEQDADAVLLLYRPDYYDQNQEQQNRAQVIVAKNRHGSTGTVEMAWDPQFTKFSELSHIEEPG